MHITAALPRYLRVAHWMSTQPRGFTSREVAGVFGVSAKTMTDDFALMRRRREVIVLEQQKVIINGVSQYIVRVLQVHPYQLDARRFPCRAEIATNPPAITWRSVLSARWQDIALGGDGGTTTV